MKKYRLLVIVPLIFSVVACKQQEETVALPPAVETAPVTESIAVTVTYLERIALSAEAVVEISLQDISLADAPATVLSRQELSNPGQVPVRFELEFNPAEIDPHMTYAIQARITDHGQLMFINDTVTPVLTRGAGKEVEMVLVRVASTPGMELTGMFRYMADAAVFRDCRNNKTYPVAMEGKYIEMERAYLNSEIAAGEEALVKLRGRLLERDGMEINTREVKLIVDSFDKLVPDETCTPSVHAELIGTYWRLDQLQGSPVKTPEGMKEAHMILAGEDSRAHGNAGCNNFFGQFTTADDALTFSALGATMMACPEAMDTEQAFLAALGNTTHYKISGLFLELYADDQLLATLEAVYF